VLILTISKLTNLEITDHILGEAENIVFFDFNLHQYSHRQRYGQYYISEKQIKAMSSAWNKQIFRV